MKNRIFIVTGAMGHLGNTIVQELVSRSETIRALALPGDQSTSFDSPLVTVYYGDVCDKASLEPIMSVPEGYETYVIHAAGIVSIASRYDDRVRQVNVEGTKNMAEISAKHDVTKFVYVSSVHALPESETTIHEVSHFDVDSVFGLYSQTKAIASQHVLDMAAKGLRAVIVHPSGIIGPYDYGHGHLTQMIRDYVEGRLTAAIHGGYDFVDVRDVASGIISAALQGRAGECYILSGSFSSIKDMLDKLSRITGKKPIRIYLPMWFAKASAPLAELYYKILHEPPIYSSYALKVLSSNSHFSHEKATKELGYTPRPIFDTLADTAHWMSDNGRMSPPKRTRKLKKTCPAGI